MQNYSLPRSTPEAQGVPTAAITAFIDDLEQKALELHSFMLLRNGSVIAEGWWAPYHPERPHMLFSLSKSFASTAVGLAAAEGLLSIDDPVLTYFPAEAPAVVGENLAAMRIRHLLSMSTGHDKDTTPSFFEATDGNWAAAFLALPVEHAPGTHFVYNSGATYMLSAIVQSITGQRLVDYLGPRLFSPLGIHEATWESCPRGINIGGWGLKIKTEDIARFGQLYLQNGLWRGDQLLPASWVQEASMKQVSNGNNPDSDWEQGYGFQFWRCRLGIYRGDGAFGQYCIIMPDQAAVLAITSAVSDMQAVLNSVWDHVLPAMGSSPLPADPAAQSQLADRLARLELAPLKSRLQARRAAGLEGKSFTFEKNEPAIAAITFAFSEAGSCLHVTTARGEDTLECGDGRWVAGQTNAFATETQPVAASGGWMDEDTYVLAVCFTETPFVSTFTCRFQDDQVTIQMKQNVAFEPSESPPLIGKVRDPDEVFTSVSLPVAKSRAV